MLSNDILILFHIAAVACSMCACSLLPTLYWSSSSSSPLIRCPSIVTRAFDPAFVFRRLPPPAGFAFGKCPCSASMSALHSGSPIRCFAKYSARSLQQIDDNVFRFELSTLLFLQREFPYHENRCFAERGSGHTRQQSTQEKVEPKQEDVVSVSALFCLWATHQNQ